MSKLKPKLKPKPEPFKVHCLDCAYDEEHEVLVFLLLLKDAGVQRIFCVPRSDFHYKSPGNEVPVEEMHRTSKMFKGRHFNWVVEDDPARNTMVEDDPEGALLEFRADITAQLEKITEGCENAGRQMVQKLADVVERDRDRKQNASVDDVLDELMMRASLKNISFGD